MMALGLDIDHLLQRIFEMVMRGKVVYIASTAQDSHLGRGHARTRYLEREISLLGGPADQIQPGATSMSVLWPHS